MSPQTQQILTNREVIAVDQDPLGEPRRLVTEEAPGLQVWVRPLSGQPSPQAVLFFNRTPQPAKMRVSWEDLGILGAAEAHDLWSYQNLGKFDTGYSILVPSHGVVMLRVTPLNARVPRHRALRVCNRQKRNQ